MKDFLKYTLATITGLILTGVLLFFFLFAAILGIMATSDTEVTVKESSVFALKLNGTLNERAVDLPFSNLLPTEGNSIGLDDIINAIKKAKKHPNIKGIYIETNKLSTSFASLEAIRNALIDFKESGKFIISYADEYTHGSYYLASVSDEIHLNPSGGLYWAGLSAQPIFYTNLLKNIGVDMQIFKVGTYKSAVEPYTEKEMSQANKEQVSVFLNDIWSHIVENVSTARNITTENLQAYADQMLLFQPTEVSLNNHLVDRLSYKTEVESAIKEKLDGKEPNFISLKKMKNVIIKNDDKIKSDGNVAVFYAEGAIVDSGSKYETEIVGNAVVEGLKKLEKNDRVKAVVLRVNSPGGSAYASEQIWKAVTDLKAKKPVIISMGDYAASGGYYISAAADYIFAEPTTLTGSIGIFAMIPSFEKIATKVGLNFDVVKTNKFSDFGSIYRSFNPEEKQLLQTYIESGYDLFVKRCAEGRNMSDEAIRKIAEGRVWTGKRALELGLVNELGGLDKAIAFAANKAGLQNYKVKDYPKQVDFFEQLMDLSAQDMIHTYLMSSKYKTIIQQAERIKQLTEESSLQARIPYVLNIQ